MLEKQVEQFLNRHALSFLEKKVMIGVSGGPDSLALLHFLWKRRELWRLQLVAVHVDHMFRGEQSYLEAIFVKEVCEKLNIDYEWTQINVPEYMEETGKSTQVGARECRYQFFEKMMEKYEANYLALAHHGDDQIETILMRMTRGSSGKARAGIPITRSFGTGEIIRPFLAVSKEEIENYCVTHRLDPRRDPSNQKPYYLRNRFRLEVVPFLRKENHSVHEHFQRMSEELYQDEIFLEELTVQKMNKVVKSRNDEGVTIDIEAFHEMPKPLQRRGIQLILNYLYKVRPSSLSALHIDILMTFLESSHPSGKLDFPEGLQISRSYQQCSFLFKQQKENEPYLFELEHPGTIELPNGGFITLDSVSEMETNPGINTFYVDPKKIVLPIIIRTRSNGDRILPKGMTGTKKIKDIFIDQKIPQSDRNGWPIVTDSHNAILWIPGLKKSIYEENHRALNRYLRISYKTH